MKRAKYRYSKYGNVKTTIDGTKFDSKAEAEYYQELKLRQRAKELEIIKLQPSVTLVAGIPGKVRPIIYIPDFLIKEKSQYVYIDVKGVHTAVFTLKSKLWAHFGPALLRIVSRNSSGAFEIEKEIVPI